MRTERPTILDLVSAVRRFLDHEVRPELRGRLGFHTRVAANALGIVEREMINGERLETAERGGLENLVGEAGPVAELNAVLCRRIEEGSLDERGDELIAHLRRTIDAKLAIDNVKYRPVAEEGSDD